MEWIRQRGCDFEKCVEKSKGVCVIPIGCVEQHGHHLPLGCDTIWGSEFVKRAAEIEPVTVFPEMYFGEKSGAGEYPGTIIFPGEVILSILEHSCYEIARNGFKKIVIASSHGGNASIVEHFCRQMLQKKPNFMVYSFGFGLPKVTDILENRRDYPYLTAEDWTCLEDLNEQKKIGGHGDFRETGYCYDTCPEDCDLSLMNKFDGTSCHKFDEFSKHSLKTHFAWMGNFPYSLDGVFHEGMNERIAKAFGQWAVTKAADAFRFLKEETISDEYHKLWFAKQK